MSTINEVQNAYETNYAAAGDVPVTRSANDARAYAKAAQKHADNIARGTYGFDSLILAELYAGLSEADGETAYEAFVKVAALAIALAEATQVDSYDDELVDEPVEDDEDDEE